MVGRPVGHQMSKINVLKNVLIAVGPFWCFLFRRVMRVCHVRHVRRVRRVQYAGHLQAGARQPAQQDRRRQDGPYNKSRRRSPTPGSPGSLFFLWRAALHTQPNAMHTVGTEHKGLLMGVCGCVGVLVRGYAGALPVLTVC